MYDIKALYEARTVAEAVELRLAHPEAVVIAGGSDVLIKLREGKMPGAELISIRDIAPLRGVSMDAAGTLKIGPLTTFSELTADALIRELGASATPVLRIYNKCDAIPALTELPHTRDGVCISARTGEGVDTLLARITEELKQ